MEKTTGVQVFPHKPSQRFSCSLSRCHTWSVTNLVETPVRSGDYHFWVWWSWSMFLVTAVAVPGRYLCFHAELHSKKDLKEVIFIERSDFHRRKTALDSSWVQWLPDSSQESFLDIKFFYHFLNKKTPLSLCNEIRYTSFSNNLHCWYLFICYTVTVLKNQTSSCVWSTAVSENSVCHLNWCVQPPGVRWCLNFKDTIAFAETVTWIIYLWLEILFFFTQKKVKYNLNARCQMSDIRWVTPMGKL